MLSKQECLHWKRNCFGLRHLSPPTTLPNVNNASSKVSKTLPPAILIVHVSNFKPCSDLKQLLLYHKCSAGWENLMYPEMWYWYQEIVVSEITQPFLMCPAFQLWSKQVLRQTFLSNHGYIPWPEKCTLVIHFSLWSIYISIAGAVDEIYMEKHTL